MIAWFKFATAGPNPRASPILELAIVLTDNSLREQVTFSVPIKPHKTWKGWQDEMSPTAKAQHRKTRLLIDCATGMALTEAEAACIDLMRRSGKRGEICLGALSPVMTRKFARAQMRRLVMWWSPYDVSLLRLRVRAQVPTPASKAQRALPAARAMVQEARKLYVALGMLDPELVPPDAHIAMETISSCGS